MSFTGIPVNLADGSLDLHEGWTGFGWPSLTVAPISVFDAALEVA